MRRAIFIALGIFTIIVGVEGLAIEKVELRSGHEKAAAYLTRPMREWEPPEWLPYLCLSSGTVVVLYSTRKKH